MSSPFDAAMLEPTMKIMRIPSNAGATTNSKTDEELTLDMLECGNHSDCVAEISSSIVKTSSSSSSSKLFDITMDSSMEEEQDVSAHRLSWLSIESFDQSHSEMESLVVTLKSKQERKGRLYSAFAYVCVIFVFGYIVASFFTSPSNGSGSMVPVDGSSEELMAYQSPKFLIPSFDTISQP